jgi:hypothetical protein
MRDGFSYMLIENNGLAYVNSTSGTGLTVNEYLPIRNSGILQDWGGSDLSIYNSVAGASYTNGYSVYAVKATNGNPPLTELGDGITLYCDKGYSCESGTIQIGASGDTTDIGATIQVGSGSGMVVDQSTIDFTKVNATDYETLTILGLDSTHSLAITSCTIKMKLDGTNLNNHDLIAAYGETMSLDSNTNVALTVNGSVTATGDWILFDCTGSGGSLTDNAMCSGSSSLTPWSTSTQGGVQH